MTDWFRQPRIFLLCLPFICHFVGGYGLKLETCSPSSCLFRWFWNERLERAFVRLLLLLLLSVQYWRRKSVNLAAKIVDREETD